MALWMMSTWNVTRMDDIEDGSKFGGNRYMKKISTFFRRFKLQNMGFFLFLKKSK